MAFSFKAFEARVSGNTELCAEGNYKIYSPGDVIISEAEKGDNVFFILKGRVKVTNFSSKGREVFHNELIAGQTFGEMAAISGQPRIACVIAKSETEVATVTRAQFMGLLRKHPDFALWIMESLVERLNVSTQKTYALVSQSIPMRVRGELIRLCEAHPSGGRDNVIIFEPAPNFSELAKRINTDRENVSREVSALARIGLTERTQDYLKILDLQGLRDVSPL